MNVHSGRVYLNSFDSVPPGRPTCKVTVSPGLINLPDLLPLSLVEGVSSSAMVFCGSPLRNILAPGPKPLPVKTNVLPLTSAPVIAGGVSRICSRRAVASVPQYSMRLKNSKSRFTVVLVVFITHSEVNRLVLPGSREKSHSVHPSISTISVLVRPSLENREE